MAQPVSASQDESLGDSPSSPRSIVPGKDGGDPGYVSGPRQKRRDGEDTIKRNHQAVIVVDRNLLFRSGLVHALDRSHFQVITECSNIEEVPFSGLAPELPILLLIGLDRGKVGAVHLALRELRRVHNDLHIIMFYDHDWVGPVPSEVSDIGNLVDAMLPKDGIGSDSVLKALDLVLLGTSVVSKEFSRRIPGDGIDGTPVKGVIAGEPITASGLGTPPLAPRSVDPHSMGSLTVREKLILSHLMKGSSNKAIAREVGIAESTVKIHVRNLMLKIDAKNRTQAAMWGYKFLV